MAAKKGALAQDPKVSANNTSPKTGNKPDPKNKKAPPSAERRFNRALEGFNANPNNPKWQKEMNKWYGRMSPDQQNNAMATRAGQQYNQMMSQYQGYDVNKGFSGYEQAFTDQLNQARDTVMNQFEARAKPEFDRQDTQFAQQMAEQGIDPNSGAYQAQYRALKQSQNDARQAAQSEAFKLGSQYQQQGFEQGKEAYMTPATIWQATQTPWEMQQKIALERQAQQNALAQSRMQTGATIASARIGAEAERDVNAMRYLGDYTNQKPVNPLAAGAAGFLSGYNRTR